MDDILASIRRILNEEDAKAPAEEPSPHAEPGAHPDVLELDDSMMLPEQPDPPHAVPVREAAVPPAPLAAPLVLSEPGAVPMPIPMPVPQPVPQPAPFAQPGASGLVAPEAAAAAAVSVGALMRTLATERTTAVHRGGPTLEDLVREEMRPLLKDWLDNHLPPLVERLVRAEIERVVSRTA